MRGLLAAQSTNFQGRVRRRRSGIPALYTYFGLFIDHDLTFDPVSVLVKRQDPDTLLNFRSPALDFDNLYGRGPSDQPYMYEGCSFQLSDKLSGKNVADA